MKLILYKIITEENKARYSPEPVGEVELADKKTIIKVKDRELKDKLSKLFNQPFNYRRTETNKDSRLTIQETATPHTRDFFRHVKPKLLDLGLKGVIEGDWE